MVNISNFLKPRNIVILASAFEVYLGACSTPHVTTTPADGQRRTPSPASAPSSIAAAPTSTSTPFPTITPTRSNPATVPVTPTPSPVPVATRRPQTPSMMTDCTGLKFRKTVRLGEEIIFKDDVYGRRMDVFLLILGDHPRYNRERIDITIDYEPLAGQGGLGVKLSSIPGDYNEGRDYLLELDVNFIQPEGRVRTDYVLHFDKRVGDSSEIVYGPKRCFSSGTPADIRQYTNPRAYGGRDGQMPLRPAITLLL